MGTTIAIACDCGRTGAGEPGTTWQCPGCGRAWPLPALPAEQATALAAIERRFRRDVVLTAIGAAVLSALPAILGDRGALLLAVPGGAALWALAVMPHLRRARRRRVEALPGFTVAG